MTFYFSDKEMEDMCLIYRACLSEISEEVVDIVETLIDYAKELKYEPVVNLAVAAISYCNNELRQDVIKVLNEWKNSKMSFSSILERISVEDKVKSKMSELQIEQNVQSGRLINDLQLTDIDMVNWRYSVSDFENIKQDIDSFFKSLEFKQEQYEKCLKKYKSENEFYTSIESLIVYSFTTVIKRFQSSIRESFLLLERICQDLKRFSD